MAQYTLQIPDEKIEQALHQLAQQQNKEVSEVILMAIQNWAIPQASWLFSALRLVTQSRQGRLEPTSTLASEILRKVAKKTSWEGMSPTEVYLDMQANPEKWKSIEIIKVANPELRRMLGATGKYVSFNMERLNADTYAVMVLQEDGNCYLLNEFSRVWKWKDYSLS